MERWKTKWDADRDRASLGWVKQRTHSWKYASWQSSSKPSSGKGIQTDSGISMWHSCQNTWERRKHCQEWPAGKAESDYRDQAFHSGKQQPARSHGVLWWLRHQRPVRVGFYCHSLLQFVTLWFPFHGSTHKHRHTLKPQWDRTHRVTPCSPPPHTDHQGTVPSVFVVDGKSLLQWSQTKTLHNVWESRGGCPGLLIAIIAPVTFIPKVRSRDVSHQEQFTQSLWT